MGLSNRFNFLLKFPKKKIRPGPLLLAYNAQQMKFWIHRWESITMTSKQIPRVKHAEPAARAVAYWGSNTGLCINNIKQPFFFLEFLLLSTTSSSFFASSHMFQPLASGVLFPVALQHALPLESILGDHLLLHQTWSGLGWWSWCPVDFLLHRYGKWPMIDTLY